jgi:hypothetical protein
MATKKLTREELYDLVWSVPLTTLSKQLKVTYSRLRTICKQTNIPLPEQGYWMRLKYNKQVEIPDLPIDINPKLVSILADLTTIQSDAQRRVIQIRIDIEETCKVYLTVPSRLTNPDKLIQEKRKDFEQAKIESWGKDKGYILPYKHHLPIFVTPKHMRRSLRILDAFIKLVKARGHSVSLESRLGHVDIGDQSYAFNIREKQRRIPGKDRGYDYRYEPTGTLILYAGQWYDKKAYVDGREKLETKLSAVLADLEYRRESLLKIWAENDARKKIEEEKERLILEAKKKEQFEKQKFRELLRDANRWHQAKILRDYIDETENQLNEVNDMSQDFQDWINWAKNKTDLYDPIINGELEYFINSK